MIGRGRRVAATAAALAAVASAAVVGGAAGPAAAATRSRAALPVSVTVTQLSPTTPVPSAGTSPFTIMLSLTNTSSAPLSNLRVEVERGDPLGSQHELDLSLADTSARSGGLGIRPTQAVTTSIPAGSSRTLKFRTTTSLSTQGSGICLCHAASVYPLDVTVHEISAGSDTVVGATRSYVPAFDATPTKMSVSWVWPLLDRPHRLADGRVFNDDALTGSVSGGQLDRSLQVLERVAGTVPMTVVTDPELLDELTIMAGGRYTVREAGGRVSPGVGQQAAQSWLARFRTLVSDHPDLTVELTPYGDPDVQSLTDRRLPWTATMPAAMAVRVSAALGGHSPDASLAWVAGGRADTATVTALARTGVDTVLLDARAVQPSSQAAVPLSLASTRIGRHSERLALTAPVLEDDISAIVSRTSNDSTKLPLLMAELAARVAQSPDSARAVVLTPPRYVDASPDDAVRVIEATSRNAFSSPAALSSVLGGSFPSPTVKLRSVPSGNGLSTSQLDRASMVRDVQPAITSMLNRSAAGRTVAAGLPYAVQRIESSAWRRDGVTGGRRAGSSLAAQLSGQANAVLSGIQIVNPRSASYTLAGSNSPLPITVRNDLPYPVAVDVTVEAVSNLPGFSADRLPVQVIPAGSKQTLKIPTSLQRSGRIPVIAVLSAPNDYRLGRPVTLFIHSTVLGTIGIVITVAAGIVLLIALLVRYLRRIRRLRARRRVAATRHPGPGVPAREPAT